MTRKLTCLLIALCLLFSTVYVAVAEEEKPVLRYLGRDATFDLSNSPMIEILQNITGYTVEYEALPAGEEGLTKLMLLLSSGTKYDIVNGFTTYFDKALAAGAIMPLDDLLQNAPNVLACVPEDSASWTRVTGSDGKIYGIPQLLPTGGPVSTIAVRKDLLDAAGIEMPTTAEEFYNMLVAVKEAYPDMIPLTTDENCSLPPVISAFDCYQSWYQLDDGTWVPQALNENYKNYIAFLNKLYTEGLIDVEFPANDDATRKAKFTSGQAVMTYFQYWEGSGFYSAMETTDPNAVIDYIPFLRDEHGNAGVEVNLGLEKIFFIPISAEHPEDAIAWADAFMANFKTIYIGEEGIDHEIVDGQYRPIMPQFSVHDTVWFFMPAIDEAVAFEYWQARVRKSEEVERGYMDTFALKVEDLNIVTSPLEMLAPNDELVTLMSQAGINFSNTMVKLITGSVSMDEYDTAVDQYNKDGGKRIVELANAMIAG